eukprot:scaffold23323_cov91-Skeletonema_marinoi.AAC.1
MEECREGFEGTRSEDGRKALVDPVLGEVGVNVVGEVLAGGGLDGLEEVEDEAMSFIDSSISGGVITNHFKFHYALQMVGVVKGILG